jgi:hypothetical protein
VLVADVELVDTSSFDLRNGSQGQATTLPPVSMFRGRHTGKSPAADGIKVGVPATFEPGGAGSLTVTVSRQSVQADVYDGVILLGAAGNPSPAPLNATVVVRNGPLTSLVLILAGIGLVFLITGLGRTATRHASGTAGMKTIDGLLEKAHQDDRERVRERVDLLRQAAHGKGWDEEQKLVAKSVISDLDSLRIVRALAGRIPTGDDFPLTKAHIIASQNFVGLGDSESAAKEADAAVVAWAVESQQPRDIDWLDAIGRRSVRFEQERRRGRSTDGDLLSRVVLNLPRITIDPKVRQGAIRTLWWVVRWGALVFFVYVGLRVAYVDNAATFTGTSIGDFLPLIAYGAGADAVSRFLGNLTKSV